MSHDMSASSDTGVTWRYKLLHERYQRIQKEELLRSEDEDNEPSETIITSTSSFARFRPPNSPSLSSLKSTRSSTFGLGQISETRSFSSSHTSNTNGHDNTGLGIKHQSIHLR